MKINWRVRFKNPSFWFQLVLSIVLPMFAYFGVNWEEMTTWARLGQFFWQAIQNPVVIVAIVVSVWNALIDPTTKGFSDSKLALSYDKPKERNE